MLKNILGKPRKKKKKVSTMTKNATDQTSEFEEIKET